MQKVQVTPVITILLLMVLQSAMRQSTKHLGLIIDDKLPWVNHIHYISVNPW